jgi:hypothetical protein
MFYKTKSYFQIAPLVQMQSNNRTILSSLHFKQAMRTLGRVESEEIEVASLCAASIYRKCVFLSP